MPITKPIKRYILFPCLMMMAAGCANLVDKGDKLFEQGMYQEAAAFYEKALLKNPNDVEATIGLNKAHNMIIDRGLIEVRMLRLGSNHAGATKKLESILRNQKAWNIEMQGAVAMTQDEETRNAEKWLRKEAENLSQSPLPDKFRWFTYSYAYLIANAQLETDFEQYQPRLKELGQKQCHSMVQDVSGQRFYMHDFVKKYCLTWGEDVSLTVDNVDHSRYQGLSTTQHVRFRTNDNAGQRTVLQRELARLEDQFKNSLWYTSKGASLLAIDVSGDVDYKKTSRRITRSAKYKTNKEVKLANGTTETREVEKTYKYAVREYSEKYKMRITYRGNVKSQTLNHELVRSENHRTEGHNTTFKPAKVSPKSASFMKIDQKFMGALDNANLQIQDKLNTLWVASYCEQGLGNHQGEYILRCGKAAPDNTYVNSWFSQKFGVDYEAMAQIYGL
ncbi:MAG: tetratricopeptide repeat protein [Gammaproteobacteria bacterium]